VMNFKEEKEKTYCTSSKTDNLVHGNTFVHTALSIVLDYLI